LEWYKYDVKFGNYIEVNPRTLIVRVGGWYHRGKDSGAAIPDDLKYKLPKMITDVFES